MWKYVGLVAFAVTAVSAQAPQQFDILIRNGRVLDGTGNPWYRADIGIRGDRIAAMGSLGNATAKTVRANRLADQFRTRKKKPGRYGVTVRGTMALARRASTRSPELSVTPCRT